MIRNSNSGDKGSIIKLINTFLPVFFHKKDDYYHLLSTCGNLKQLFFACFLPLKS